MNTAQIFTRIMAHWKPPEYYTLCEVRNGTGYNRAARYADALAMSVWPSRGIELIGAEVKASRSDWLHEKKTPEKAEGFFKHCHRWYLITGPDVAKEEEIPSTWGWIVAGPKGLRSVKAAPTLEPQLPDWSFLASIFRNAAAGLQGFVAAGEVERLADAKMAETVKTLRGTIEALLKSKADVERDFYALRAAVQTFNAESGVTLDTWKIPDEAAAQREGQLYRAFREGGIEAFKRGLVQHADQLRQVLGTIERMTA